MINGPAKRLLQITGALLTLAASSLRADVVQDIANAEQHVGNKAKALELPANIANGMFALAESHHVKLPPQRRVIKSLFNLNTANYLRDFGPDAVKDAINQFDGLDRKYAADAKVERQIQAARTDTVAVLKREFAIAIAHLPGQPGSKAPANGPVNLLRGPQ